MKRFQKIVGFIFIAAVVITSCKKNNENEDPETVYQKSDLMSNIGTNLIIPEYQQFLTDINDLESKYLQFSSDKTESNLDELKNAWKAAYIDWYSVNVYELGPANNVALRSSIGTFPTDTMKVINNITNGGYVLGSLDNIDAIGLPCFDFLLYRNNALTYFINSAAYTQYGLDLIQKMKSEVSSVVNSWNGTYLTTFKNSTGTEATSDFSVFVNQFNIAYELIKNAKLGIPIGKQSLGIQRPEYLEARMSAISLELLYENVKALQRVFNGNSKNGTSGQGFDDYLVALDRASLESTINSQFNAILTSIDQFTLTLEEEMSVHPQELDALYTKLQNLVISIKTDMSSAFGVLISYQDNDGD